MSSKRPRWLSTCYRPFLIGSAVCLSILYKIFPSMFALLAKSFPIAICAALMLGILLIYGESSIPRTKEEGGRDVSSNIMIKNQDKVHNPINRRKANGEVEGKEWRAAMVLAEMNNVAQKLGATSDTFQSTADENGSVGFDHDCCFSSSNSISSCYVPAHHRDASADSEHNDEESSAASDADVMPLLDELDPLLDPEADQAALAADNSDAFSHDRDSNDDSIAEEAGILDDEDDDETHEEKEDESKAAVTWTADDQSNLVHLGNSELERNHRLESLIVRRRSMKIPQYRIEKNLIDLDGFDFQPSKEEISWLNAQLSTIYAPRKNPFDLPFDADDTVPGSAPSILLQRQNPFYQDIGAIGSLGPQEGLATPSRDAMFRRHESFTVGASFFGDLDQDRFAYRFKPYFSTAMGEDEGIFSELHRQLSEMSDSNASSTTESDTASSGIDQKHTEDLHQESEDVKFIAESVDRASFESSNEVESTDIEHVVNDTIVGGDHEIHAEINISLEQTHQSARALGATEDDTSENLEADPVVSNAENVEVLYEDIESRTPSPSKSDEEQTVKDEMDHAFSNDSAKEIDEESENMNEVEQVPVYDSSPSAAEKSKAIFSTGLEEILLPTDKGDLTPGNSLSIHTEESNSGDGPVPTTIESSTVEQ